jgi:hypothetical protein
VRTEQTNPAVLLLRSLANDNLEVRLTEALPWVLASYPDVDWSWLTDQAKLKDVQNRLGFLVGLARQLAASREEFRPALESLQRVETKLERARLAREDTHFEEPQRASREAWLKMQQVQPKENLEEARRRAREDWLAKHGPERK